MDRKFDPLTPGIGTEITGVDLGTITPGEMDSIKRLLDERLVLVFRNQRIAREQHKALGRCFGTGALHRHAPAARAGMDPEVLQVRATGRAKPAAPAVWRSDLSSEPRPLSTSLVYLLEPPQGGGGDTVFANTVAAYETLSEPMRKLADGLTAIHDGGLPWRYHPSLDREGPFSQTEHPVVVTHPETGRRLLWVNRAFTARLVGVSELESRHLLETLFQHVESNPALHCRVRWQANTVVIWDNVAAQYFPCYDYHPHIWYGERVSSRGHRLGRAAHEA